MGRGGSRVKSGGGGGGKFFTEPGKRLTQQRCRRVQKGRLGGVVDKKKNRKGTRASVDSPKEESGRSDEQLG